jgi:hypothetical protein
VRRIFFMLTAFYVDNGKNLPLWRELPVIAFWILPSAIGVPLMLYALLRSCIRLLLSRLYQAPINNIVDLGHSAGRLLTHR